MNEQIKNRIIAISGEPVSGKGTTIKKMVEILKKQGYSENNIHVISTGHQFREYFEKIIDFIRNVNDNEKIKKLGEDEKLRRILENKEYRNVLQNTISNIQKNNINLDNISKISELNNSEIFGELRSIIDTLIDSDTKRMGEEINKAERAREERRIGEIKRYKERYGVNLEDEENYDLIIDTTFAEVDDIAKTVLRCEDLYREKKLFGKNWASGFTMIPSQTIRETIYPQIGSEWTLEKLEKEIKEERI